MPTADYAYSSTSGLPTTISTTSGTITHTYDQDGRLKTYTDADANQSTYGYDTSDRATTINDGKGSETLSYDQGSERRGLLTGITDSQAGDFSATYNADGALVTQWYPNGMTATRTFDETGQPVALVYVKTSNCSTACTWYADQVSPSIHGQWLAQSGSPSGQSYTYDAVGRLSWVYDTLNGQCTTRQYTFDADSNRTALTTRSPNTDGSCNTTIGGATQSSSYDTADRATTSGYAFDVLGRVTTVPAADAGGATLTSTYYVNDMVNTLTQSGTTDTASLDPTRRIRQWVTSSDSTATKISHFASDDDSPNWIAENTSGTAWTRNVLGPYGLAAIADQVGITALQLPDLRGDIVATANTSQTATSLTGTFEQTEFGQSHAGQSQSRYSYLGAYQRATTNKAGAVTMGVRIYLPTTGRFLQTDPLEGGSSNSYDYARQDPVNNTDIAGLSPSGCFYARVSVDNLSAWSVNSIFGTYRIWQRIDFCIKWNQITFSQRTRGHSTPDSGGLPSLWYWDGWQESRHHSVYDRSGRWIRDYWYTKGGFYGVKIPTGHDYTPWIEMTVYGNGDPTTYHRSCDCRLQL